jgi:hypothetical protein
VPKVIEILLLIAMPLGWGLGVEFIFERLRRRLTNRHRNDGPGRP